MEGGITQKFKPIDMILVEIFKGYYREYCGFICLLRHKRTKVNPCL